MEADAERQIIEKTEFLSEKTRVVKIDDDTPIRVKTVSMLLSLDKAAVVMELDEQLYYFPFIAYRSWFPTLTVRWL